MQVKEKNGIHSPKGKASVTGSDSYRQRIRDRTLNPIKTIVEEIMT